VRYSHAASVETAPRTVKRNFPPNNTMEEASLVNRKHKPYSTSRTVYGHAVSVTLKETTDSNKTLRPTNNTKIHTKQQTYTQTIHVHGPHTGAAACEYGKAWPHTVQPPREYGRAAPMLHKTLGIMSG
jgi:hypothetical protein